MRVDFASKWICVLVLWVVMDMGGVSLPFPVPSEFRKNQEQCFPGLVCCIGGSGGVIGSLTEAKPCAHVKELVGRKIYIHRYIYFPTNQLTTYLTHSERVYLVRETMLFLNILSLRENARIKRATPLDKVNREHILRGEFPPLVYSSQCDIIFRNAKYNIISARSLKWLTLQSCHYIDLYHKPPTLTLKARQLLRISVSW